MKIMTAGPITSWQIDGETMETVSDFILGGSKSLQMVTVVMKLKDTCSLEKSYDKPRQHIKKQRHHFADKALVKAMFFPVAMYRCKNWTIKQTELEELMPSNAVMEKTLESPLACKRVKPVKPKGNQPLILTGSTDAEAPILGHLM